MSAKDDQTVSVTDGEDEEQIGLADMKNLFATEISHDKTGKKKSILVRSHGDHGNGHR